MQVSEEEMLDLKDFIFQLNEKKDSIVIVEGKRDSAALKKLGFVGNITEFHKYGGITKFADSVSEYQNVILLLDGDRKGRYLTGRIIEQIQHRTRIDLSFKKNLISITKGKIRFIEQLGSYEYLL